MCARRCPPARDVWSVPASALPVVADARITFRLAAQDPVGNTTTGITRTPTTATSFATFRDDVTSSTTGGADPWPSDDYLNVWVCAELRDEIGRSILGYEYVGGPTRSSPSRDGSLTSG
jgi:hypothetical protein